MKHDMGLAKREMLPGVEHRQHRVVCTPGEGKTDASWLGLHWGLCLQAVAEDQRLGMALPPCDGR